MKITLLSLFPESFESFLGYPVIKRAIQKGLVEVEVCDIREYTSGSYRDIDDSPYGGGAGMLLRVDSLDNALRNVRKPSSRVVLMGPKGRRFDQALAHEFSIEEHLILLSGHYEGVDERIKAYIDEEVSIGDYILTGGESASIVVAEAVIRLLEGALKKGSAEEESFENTLLEHPQYTRPEEYKGRKVPTVLLSGNREEIEAFKEREAIKDTLRLRPDLLPSDKEFQYHRLHRNYGNEKDMIPYLVHGLPVEKIVHSNEEFLLFSKNKGRRLSECGRNKMIKTSLYVLKQLWSLDISTCPCLMTACSFFSRVKREKLSYPDWEALKEMENFDFKEDLVFSHGSLNLENILVNGDGVTAIINLQKAGIADRYRDLASLISSLEERGISSKEIIPHIGIDVDEKKLSYFSKLGRLEGRLHP